MCECSWLVCVDGDADFLRCGEMEDMQCKFFDEIRPDEHHMCSTVE